MWVLFLSFVLSPKNNAVCTFKTLPVCTFKNAPVFAVKTSVCHTTHGRLNGTDEGVLKVHEHLGQTLSLSSLISLSSHMSLSRSLSLLIFFSF